MNIRDLVGFKSSPFFLNKKSCPESSENKEAFVAHNYLSKNVFEEKATLLAKKFCYSYAFARARVYSRPLYEFFYRLISSSWSYPFDGKIVDDQKEERILPTKTQSSLHLSKRDNKESLFPFKKLTIAPGCNNEFNNLLSLPIEILGLICRYLSLAEKCYLMRTSAFAFNRLFDFQNRYAFQILQTVALAEEIEEKLEGQESLFVSTEHIVPIEQKIVTSTTHAFNRSDWLEVASSKNLLVVERLKELSQECRLDLIESLAEPFNEEGNRARWLRASSPQLPEKLLGEKPFFDLPAFFDTAQKTLRGEICLPYGENGYHGGNFIEVFAWNRECSHWSYRFYSKWDDASKAKSWLLSLDLLKGKKEGDRIVVPARKPDIQVVIRLSQTNNFYTSYQDPIENYINPILESKRII